METLDLHGESHRKAELLVENFILLNDPPVRVIPGNSIAMQTLVKQVLICYNLTYEVENDWNLGSWIVREK